jgi:hypothetical protein
MVLGEWIFLLIIFKKYKMKKRDGVKLFKNCKQFIVTSIVLLNSMAVSAQDGNAGINEANTQVRSYFDSGTNLMYAVGAIVGLIGAIKVYNKWNAGDHDTGKVAAAWFGSCVFLVVVATVIKSFFGV